jgi:hypothetical protein
MDRTQRPPDAVSHSETLDPGAIGGRSQQGGGVATLDPSAWSPAATEPSPAAFGGATGTMVAPGAASGTLLPGGGGGGGGILAGLHAAAKSTSAGPIRPLSQVEVDLANRRLEYLCGLITTARGEYCPINGMLLVLPLAWAGLTPGSDTDRITRSAREDVETAYRAFGLAFPTTVAITGFEKTSGLRQFVERGMRLNSKFLDSRAGSKFPPGAAIDETSARWVIDAGVQWFRDWCYSLFSQNLSDTTNGLLYRLLCELQTRRDPLIRQLQLTFEGVSGAEAARLAGVYYCAAGRSERDRAFVQGIFRKLVDAQDDVAWTEDRLKTDSRRRSLAVAGLAAAVALIAADGYLLYALFDGG